MSRELEKYKKVFFFFVFFSKTKWDSPHCMNAVDGKHIDIIGCGMVSQYYHWKGTNSIVHLLVDGSSYEVTWADVGINGRISDGGVLKRSKMVKCYKRVH